MPPLPASSPLPNPMSLQAAVPPVRDHAVIDVGKDVLAENIASAARAQQAMIPTSPDYDKPFYPPLPSSAAVNANFMPPPTVWPADAEIVPKPSRHRACWAHVLYVLVLIGFSVGLSIALTILVRHFQRQQSRH